MATATKEAVIQVRVNARLKKDAQKTLKGMGLDVSTAINMFLHKVVTTQSIPFEVRTVNGFTPAQEREYLEAAKDPKNGKLYNTVDEMMDDIK